MACLEKCPQVANWVEIKIYSRKFIKLIFFVQITKENLWLLQQCSLISVMQNKWGPSWAKLELGSYSEDGWTFFWSVSIPTINFRSVKLSLANHLQQTQHVICVLPLPLPIKMNFYSSCLLIEKL